MQGLGYEPVYLEQLSGLAPIYYDSKTGDAEPNDILTKTTPYQLTWDEQAGASVVSVPAKTTVTRKMTTDKGGMVDIRRIKGIATNNNLTLYILDNEFQRYLSNRPIHFNLICGDGPRPFDLPIPLLLHRTQSLIFDVTDKSATPSNDVRLVLEGQRYYFDSQNIYDSLSPATKISRPYFYTTDDSVTITAGMGTNEVTTYITIMSDSDFYCHRFLTYSDGDYQVKMENVAISRGFSNGWIHSQLVGGNSQYYRSMEPMVFQRKTQIRLKFVNLSASLNHIYFALAGYNMYYRR